MLCIFIAVQWCELLSFNIVHCDFLLLLGTYTECSCFITFDVFLQIERVQNIRLYQQYQAHKAALDSRNPSGHQNEKKLWHGSPPDSITKINHNGFDRGYCGRHGK